MQTLETHDLKRDTLLKKHIEGWGKSVDSKLYIDILKFEQNNDWKNAQKANQRLNIALTHKIYTIFKEKRDQAILDEELTHVNEASDEQFIDFLNEHPTLKTPAFFVNSFNNIELTWRNLDKEAVDLQFLGDGQVQFVIFSKRFGTKMTRVSGRDSDTRMRAMIQFYGLQDLVYEPS
jgi:hypothetical protein